MRRPDASALLVFVLVVLVGGSNFVAVRFSNRELAPFWGGAVRIGAASLLFFAITVARAGTGLRGLALWPTARYGVVNFGLSYALAYFGLVAAPAALGSTFVALTPLLTFLLALVLGMERFRWAGLLGAAVAVAGILVVFADQLGATVPLPSLAALALLPVAISVAQIQAKRIPRSDPFATNGIAAVPGTALLLGLAVASGERIALPAQTATWIALGFLVASTVVLFAGILYILQRWTASAAAYATVLNPIVTVALGAVLAGELVTARFVLGAFLVMAGTYLGALLQPRAWSFVATAEQGRRE